LKHFPRILTLFVILCLAALALPSPAGAFPPLPSSLWGTVKQDGANVADGTLVEALIGSRVFASTSTQTYQGDSVYALDIPGDDTSTAAIEGGVEGDTIQVRVGGYLASQTATWQSGKNQNLDLSVGSQQATATVPSTVTATLPATATQKPTATPIPGALTATSAPDQATPSPTLEQPGQAEPQATATPQASSTPNPDVVTLVDESFPATATLAASQTAPAETPDTTNSTSAPAGTISIYWVLIPVFFLGVWLFGLWYIKRKQAGIKKS